MSDIKIQKAKLVEGERLEVTYFRNGGKDETTVNEKHKATVHPDLKKSFSDMAIHLALLSDFAVTSDIDDITSPDEELTRKFEVRGFSYGGAEGEEGVVLSGHKILRNGKALGLNTPFTRFTEAEESIYQFIDDLQDRLDHACDEVKAYIMGAKIAPDPQPELAFGDNGAT